MVPPVLMVTFEPKASWAAAVSVSEAPLLMVTAPVNVFVPVALVMLKVPLVPAPTVVVPVTVKANAPATLKVVASPTKRLLPTTLAAPSVQVFVPEPEVVRLL